MLHDVGAQDRFQSDDNPAINPGWKTLSSRGVCRAARLCVAVGNSLIAYSRLTNESQHIDVKPHTFCVQTELDARKASMMVLSTPSPTWYPAVCKARQVQAKTCGSSDALRVAWWGPPAQYDA